MSSTSFSKLYKKDSIVDKNLMGELGEKIENFRERLQRLITTVDHKEHVFTSFEASEVILALIYPALFVWFTIYQLCD